MSSVAICYRPPMGAWLFWGFVLAFVACICVIAYCSLALLAEWFTDPEDDPRHPDHDPNRRRR